MKNKQNKGHGRSYGYDKPSIVDTLNGDLYKESAKYHKSAVKQMIKAIIKKTPKEVLIEVLTELKIIQRDWSRKGNKYKLK